MAMQGEVRAGGWARRGRRVLLGLGALGAAGLAVLFLAALVVVHGGPLQAVLLTVLTLIIVAALLAAVVGWIALRLWRRGAWLEALPLLVGLPWLSRVVWAARVLWTGRALWRLRARVRPAPRL
jgi:ABC-type branched-subunit amino acid transport system permease subunit